MILVKALVVVQIGTIDLSRRANVLADGTLPEQALGWLFQPDQMTTSLAHLMTGLLH